MTNTKKTKRALLGSVIALILCLSMLVGTTFAWFTDSVVSGKNHIVAGNLDIELEYLVDGDWVAVDESTNIFGNSLWEPGHTEVVALRVANVGSLALKYQMGINVIEEITSINVAGEELKLSDYIEFGIVDGQYTDRTAARAAVTNATKISEGYTVDEELSLLPGESEEITLVVYMPETVGNEANHLTGEVAPEIWLGINLMATQLMHEEDSFGNDYDKDAFFAFVSQKAPVTVPLTDLNTLQLTGEEVELDVAYSFKTTQSYEEATQNAYAKHHADFVVSFDKDVAAESVVLGGQYDSWSSEWVAFKIPMAVAANEEVRLLGTAGINMNYEELCLLVKEFLCGAANLDTANNGTTMTVELRLYEVEEPSAENGNSWNVETGAYQTFGVYKYTFGNPSTVPTATVYENPAFVGTDLTWDASSPVADVQLESAYTFNANETDPAEYADWDADFYVSIDRDIADGQLILAGQYDAWSDGWIGFAAPATAANTPVALLASAGVEPTYWEVCNIIETFNCGVADVSDALAGATITVQLVLTNGTETVVVSTNSYTF